MDALAGLLQALTAQEITRRREAAAAAHADRFDKAAQQRRMRAFVSDLLADRARVQRS